jgi:hypothetical protein
VRIHAFYFQNGASEEIKKIFAVSSMRLEMCPTFEE